MTLKTSLTGSYPPIYNPDEKIRLLPQKEQDALVHNSIKRAIRDQIQMGIDILVDGQVRDDIVSLFASKLSGYEGQTLPYCAVAPIRPADEPITVADYLYAKKCVDEYTEERKEELELRSEKIQLKAHITGPMTMAKATRVETSAYANSYDPRLVMDLAHALGQEARLLVEAGAQIVQIDEPVLVDGVDLDLAFRAMREVIETGEVPFPGLHICGNVSQILKDVLESAPVKMISLEGEWLKRSELRRVDRDLLLRCGKQIGLGSIKVSDYKLEKITMVQNFMDEMIMRLGEENIWAIMPNCGLRAMPYDIVQQKLLVMVEAVKSL
jgi:5-methyltetrahydropteroyltriglutamate--homocysteine methyltransferase